jgi:hypothetical protein
MEAARRRAVQSLRRGITVLKYDRRGHTHKRVLSLEEGGAEGSPRLSWRPKSGAYAALRSMMQKPAHMNISDIEAIDGTCSAPRIQRALSLRKASSSDSSGRQARPLAIALSSPSQSLEFELLPDEGMSEEEAAQLHGGIISALQSLHSSANPNKP